jgi:hypothetical protein
MCVNSHFLLTPLAQNVLVGPLRGFVGELACNVVCCTPTREDWQNVCAAPIIAVCVRAQYNCTCWNMARCTSCRYPMPTLAPFSQLHGWSWVGTRSVLVVRKQVTLRLSPSIHQGVLNNVCFIVIFLLVTDSTKPLFKH